MPKADESEKVEKVNGEKPETEKKEKPEKKEKKVIQEPVLAKGKKLPVIYPEVRVDERYAGKMGGLTEDEAKVLLEWRTEDQAIAIEIEKHPKLKPEDIDYGNDYLFVDEEDNKVRCLNNRHNRPHDKDTSHKYCQDVLSGNWAGPLMLPQTQEEVYGGDEAYTLSDGTVIQSGETITVVNGTVNGETIVIGRYGNIISGQHRLIGFVWACQLWRKEPERYADKWTEPPVLESIVVLGVSEDPRVVRTIDNVKPRQLSDVFYTSPIFADLRSAERKTCSDMGQKAINTLWQRTVPGDLDIYQTHSESVNFVERHGGMRGRLVQAIRFIHKLNETHILSLLRLSPGQCASLLYLMASSSSDGEKYRNGSPPSEKLCKWDREDRAEKFWQELVKNKASDGEEPLPVEAALKAIVDVFSEEDDSPTRESATMAERMVVLARAWLHMVEGGELFEDSEDVFEKIRLKMTSDYATNEQGKRRLEAISNFGGIDLGSRKPKKEEDPEEVEAGKTGERKAREKMISDAAEKHNAKVRAKQDATEEPDSEDVPEALKEQRQTRKRIEDQQRNKAADADFLKMWTEWSREGKLIKEGGDVYKSHFAEWANKLGRSDIRAYLAELVREGKAKPLADGETVPEPKKPQTKIKLRPGNASK